MLASENVARLSKPVMGLVISCTWVKTFSPDLQWLVKNASYIIIAAVLSSLRPVDCL
jgi:hypothetical protein